MSDTILVTGGAGFIGSHTVCALLAREQRVISVDNFNDYYDPTQKRRNVKEFETHPRFQSVEADITDQAAMTRLFTQVQPAVVIHLAARAGVRPSITRPELYTRNNVEGTVVLLEQARRMGVKQFLFASSSSVYGINSKVPFSEDDPVELQISPYGLTKKAGEEFCRLYHRSYGLACTCLRFFTVYGPAGRPDMAPWKFTAALLEGRPIEMFGDGSTERDYTYIDDIVQGILAALDRILPFEIINLGGSQPIPLRRFIEVVEAATGKKAQIVSKPLPPGDVPRTYADTAKAELLLDFRPRVRIEEGMGRFVGWYRGSLTTGGCRVNCALN
jgi:UDP-glucuronate 4-epimerase